MTGIRKFQFANNEYYHIYNRGVDKRIIFSEISDMDRFFQSMEEFNTIDPIGSIFENSFRKKESLGSSRPKQGKLVNFVCYCLNPNHYHFVLEQVIDNGIKKFMQRLGGGYANYFNNKYDRTGSLFQGRYKAIHIDSNEYLLHVSAYTNLNNRVHKPGPEGSVFKSSWGEYVDGGQNGFCEKDIILGQFQNIEEYKKFAKGSLVDIRERKNFKKCLLE